MRIGLLVMTILLVVTSAMAQIPTANGIESVREPSRSDSIEPVVAPQTYDRTMVAPDTLSAVIDTLNDPTHERAYRAALAEIRETLVKQRVAALIMIYKQRIIEQATAALGGVSNLQDVDQQTRIFLKALELHQQPLTLPTLPPGYHANGMPKTPASVMRTQQKLIR